LPHVAQIIYSELYLAGLSAQTNIYLSSESASSLILNTHTNTPTMSNQASNDL